MTLIAAFQCYGGAVICADSQETLVVPTPSGYADYRCQVSKIKPQWAREYDCVIGGSGDGPLVDSFSDQLLDDIRSWDAGLDAPTIKSKIRLRLLDFHRNEVAISPVEDKSIAFVVCLKHRAQGLDPMLWELRGTGVREIDNYSLIGWDEAICRHFADRLYKGPRSSFNRALLVGVYLMMLGKSTSNVIGGPTKVIRIGNNYIREEDADTVTEIERRIEAFSRILEDLTLWCPDPDVPNHEFIGYLGNVEQDLMRLREQYLGPTMRRGEAVIIPPPKLTD